MDEVKEGAVLGVIKKEIRDNTVGMAAYRLETLRDCDLILVLEGRKMGRVKLLGVELIWSW